MDQERIAHQMLAHRAGLDFINGLKQLTQKLPSPAGTSLRITVTVIDGGKELGSVDMDTTNLDDLGRLAARRAATFQPQPSTRPVLRVIGGGM